MDTGTGLFCGLVILGVIYLYTQTKDRWNWKKIVFSMIGILLILLGIFWLSLWLPKQLTPNAGVDKPKLITSSDGISLGDTLADVEFKKGKLKTYQDFFKEKRDNFVDHPQILEVFHRVVGQLAVKRRRGGHANVVQKQSVAIRNCLGNFVGPNGAPSASRVVDHHDHTAQGLAHGFGQITCHTVSWPTGGKRHHDGDGLVFDWEISGLNPACKRSEGQQTH